MSAVTLTESAIVYSLAQSSCGKGSGSGICTSQARKSKHLAPAGPSSPLGALSWTCNQPPTACYFPAVSPQEAGGGGGVCSFAVCPAAGSQIPGNIRCFPGEKTVGGGSFPPGLLNLRLQPHVSRYRCAHPQAHFSRRKLFRVPLGGCRCRESPHMGLALD